MVFYAAFNSILVISRRQLTLFMSFLGFTSTRLSSEVSCPRTLPRINPDEPVRLEPRTPGFRVKHFATEPRGTLSILKTLDEKKMLVTSFFSFSHKFSSQHNLTVFCHIYFVVCKYFQFWIFLMFCHLVKLHGTCIFNKTI